MPPTGYQQKVNSLTGAMGPTRGAFWNSYITTTGNPVLLSAQPLYYDPKFGEYVTSYAQNAAPQSISFKSKGTVNFSSNGKSFGKKRSFTRRRKFSKRRRSVKKKSHLKKRALRGMAPPSAFTKEGTLKLSWLKKASKNPGLLGKRARAALKRRSRKSFSKTRRSKRKKKVNGKKSKRRKSIPYIPIQLEKAKKYVIY